MHDAQTRVKALIDLEWIHAAMFKAQPHNATHLGNLAIVKISRKKYKEAVELFQKARVMVVVHTLSSFGSSTGIRH